ncbi:MAG: ligase-associated DNA damage response endonuclease PdeM [Flavobacteriales bacterium]
MEFPSIEIAQQLFVLHPSKALYVKESETLVISDLHIGKVEHFRKNGILIPAQANKNNFWRLVEAVEAFKPKRIVFLGDVAHSQHNHEWDEFVDVLDQFPEMQRVLVEGNHDIFDRKVYEASKIEVVDFLLENGVKWVHEPCDSESGEYVIAGHIHPAIRMYGEARQGLRLPCFLFGEKQGLMPAFGEFTGTFTVRPKKVTTYLWSLIKSYSGKIIF